MEILRRTDPWREAIRRPVFRWLLGAGLIGGVAVLAVLTRFFQYVEGRRGVSLRDAVLARLPAHDVSLAIFLLIWLTSLLLLVRCLREPVTLLLFVYGFIFLTLSRLASMWLVPLEPPAGLIPLADPLANHFYGDRFITKDLFYSGHTATLFLISRCFRRRAERVAGLLASLAVGVLVLVQRVHYTVDVLAAFPFAALCYYSAVKLIQSASSARIKI